MRRRSQEAARHCYLEKSRSKEERQTSIVAVSLPSGRQFQRTLSTTQSVLCRPMRVRAVEPCALLAAESRKMDANAVANAKFGRRLTAFSWRVAARSRYTESSRAVSVSCDRSSSSSRCCGVVITAYALALSASKRVWSPRSFARMAWGRWPRRVALRMGLVPRRGDHLRHVFQPIELVLQLPRRLLQLAGQVCQPCQALLLRGRCRLRRGGAGPR